MFKRRTPRTPIQHAREMFWPSIGFRRAGQYLWKRISRLNGSPHAVALGFAAGAFASFTPFVGFHFIVGFCVAWAVRGNIIASAFGTVVGNPLTFPFIWLATYDLGRFVMGEAVEADPGRATHEAFWKTGDLTTITDIFLPMMIGAVPLGMLAATLCYFPVKAAVSGFQHRRRVRFAERLASEVSAPSADTVDGRPGGVSDV